MTKETNYLTRREFVEKSSLAGISLLTTNRVSSAMGRGADKSPNKKLSIRPRYHRWHVDPGVEWLESNTSYAFLDWTIPISQTGLVLVDVWQRHYLNDTEERGEKIIDECIVPLVQNCRENGMAVIHAPGPTVAKKHPNRIKARKVEIKPPINNAGEKWPPENFKMKTGGFEEYARPIEPREVERQNLPLLEINPKVQPLDSEVVLGTQGELHDFCRRKGILFLFYVGFNTNACLITRDYGLLEMSKLGYEIILVRDATTGMESSITHDSLDQTKNAILFFEMFGQYSITSREIIEGTIG